MFAGLEVRVREGEEDGAEGVGREELREGLHAVGAEGGGVGIGVERWLGGWDARREGGWG